MAVNLNASPLFALGQQAMTANIQHLITEEKLNPRDITRIMYRHVTGDWSEMDADDAKLNVEAVKTGEDRIFSSYTVNGIKLWVITEHDRSVTTVLLPTDY